MVASRPGLPSWMSTAATKVDANFNREQQTQKQNQKQNQSVPIPDANLSFGERALSAAGAAFVSAILVNPLDVAKVGSSKVCSFLGFWNHKLCFRDYLGCAHFFILD